MYGKYKCKKCGCEVDPSELHNGICDECNELEQEYNFTVSVKYNGFSLSALYQFIGSKAVSWDKWKNKIMEVNPHLTDGIIQRLDAGTKIKMPYGYYIGKMN